MTPSDATTPTPNGDATMNTIKRISGRTIQATTTFDMRLDGEALEVTATRDAFGRVVLNGVTRWSDGKHIDLTAAMRAEIARVAAGRIVG